MNDMPLMVMRYDANTCRTRYTMKWGDLELGSAYIDDRELMYASKEEMPNIIDKMVETLRNNCKQNLKSTQVIQDALAATLALQEPKNGR